MSDTTITHLHTYDVFLSFRGRDTRSNFISFLYKELVSKNIRTFKDDEHLECGQRILPALNYAIEDSKIAVVVVSKNYVASPWCLQELVKIMDLENKGLITVMPIFYSVTPCQMRWQNGEVAEQFKKHEAREEYYEKVPSWRQALKDLTSISGVCSLEREDDSTIVDKLTHLISKKLMIANGSHCFPERSVKRNFQDRQLPNIHEGFKIRRIQEECLSKSRLKNQRVPLVPDNVNSFEHVEDLACLCPGSVVIITTHDMQLLSS